MKKAALTIFALVLFMLMAGEIYTHVSGQAAGYSGGAGEFNCTKCHAGTVNSGTGTVSLTSNAPFDIYTPGDTYTITATVTQTGLSRFGFQTLSAYNPVLLKTSGTQVLISTTETQVKSLGTKRYVTHKLASSTGTGTRTWTYKWVAPNPTEGTVVFYGDFNAANNNNATSGDKIYTTSLTLDAAPVHMDDLKEADFEASVYPTLAEDVVNVEWNRGSLALMRLEVFSISGDRIHTADYPGIAESASFETTGWARGTYIVRLLSGDKVSVHKIVKL
jgi:hypothetical protein